MFQTNFTKMTKDNSCESSERYNYVPVPSLTR